MKSFYYLAIPLALAACGRDPQPGAAENGSNMVAAEQVPGDVIVPPDETAGDNAGVAANTAD